MSRTQTTSCEICGKPTISLGTKRCNNCWEVEHRLKDYLKNPKGQEFARSQMPLLDDWVDGTPDAWDYEAVLRENSAEVEWSDNVDGWNLTWKHGYMFIGSTAETIARKAGALFICLWLREVSASFADKLMDGFVVFLERQNETALSFLAETDSYSDGRPFFRLTRENFISREAFTNVEWRIIETLNVQPDEEVLVTFRKGKKHPTEVGRERYSPDGYYTANGENVPCTCRKICPNNCKGQCGCLACHDAYGDFLSSQGD